MATNAAIESIYEAALLPELWPQAFDTMSALSGSATGALFVTGADGVIHGVASPLLDGGSRERISRDDWRKSPRLKHVTTVARDGFTRIEDIPGGPDMSDDPFWRGLRAYGVAHEVVTCIPVPSGEILSFGMARLEARGPYEASDIALLNGLRPHLTRAGLLSARLTIRHAEAAVSTLEKVGLPAAVIGRENRLLAHNAFFRPDRKPFLTTAFGGIALSNPAHNRDLREAVGTIASDERGGGRSIALPGRGEHAPMVVHLLPIRGRTRDLFANGQVLIVVSTIARRSGPQPDLLHGLFDLSPAEARLVGELMTGATLPEIAAHQKLSVETLRTQLKSVFDKTGFRRQAELVGMLAGL